ncbi:ARAP1 isoform 21, partial [Pongo abelii]
KKKLRPPTCWGFTVVHETEKHEKQQWYLCCDTQMELREWFATFLFVQHDGLVWPSEPSRVSRAVPEVRLGSVSLIPLRGSENEMRRSVAAFTADPLSVSGSPCLWAEGWGPGWVPAFYSTVDDCPDCPPRLPSGPLPPASVGTLIGLFGSHHSKEPLLPGPGSWESPLPGPGSWEPG